MTAVRFSALLLEGLDHYRKGRMLEAVRAWEEAYLLEPTNLRAREFLRSALERIHTHMGANGAPAPGVPAQLPPRPATLATPVTGRVNVPALPPVPPGPWDDGPSVAIPQDASPGDESSGAWSIHRDPHPRNGAAADELEVWRRGARELVALNDFSGALELLQKILEKRPDDAEARQLQDRCEHDLTLMYESRLGDMHARPRIVLKPDEIIWLNLDPRAGFVLAQIDGEVSFEDLYAICGLKRLDTARILAQLLDEGVVQVDPAAASPRRPAQR